MAVHFGLFYFQICLEAQVLMKNNNYPTNNELNQPPEESEWFTAFKGADASLCFVFLLDASLIFFSGHNVFLNWFFLYFFFS